MENRTLGCGTLNVRKYEVCRLCMKTQEYYLSIFVSNAEFKTSIGKAIEDLLVLKVAKDDNLPEIVCCPCVTKLMEFREFKEMCMNSAREFGRHAPKEPITCPVKDEFLPMKMLGEGTGGTWNNFVDGESQIPVAPNDLSLDPFAFENQRDTKEVYPRDPLGESDHCGEEDFAESVCNEDAAVCRESKKFLIGDQVDCCNKSKGLTEEPEKESDIFCADRREISQNKIFNNPFCDPVSDETLQLEYSMANSYVVDCFPERKEKKQKKNIKFNSSSKKFSQLNNNERHMRNHESKQLCHQAKNTSYPTEYTCNYCSTRYSEKNALAIHIKKHLDGTRSARVMPKTDSQPRFSQNLLVKDRGNVASVILETSNISFTQKSSRRNDEKPALKKSSRDDNLGRKPSPSRMSLFHNVKPREKVAFVCDTCGIAFLKKSDLVKHVNVHTAMNPCRYQQKGVVTHTNFKPLKCDLCGKNFKNTKYLKCHLVVHSGVKAFKCSECGKTFVTKSDLNRHSRIHSGVMPFKCNECGKMFPQSIGLKMHSLIHNGVRPFKCNECGKMFLTTSQLKRHSVVHTRAKRFKCNECGKMFLQTSHLKRHSVVHTGVKEFKCNECGKMFNTSSNLRSHSRIHSDVNPFKCEVCDKEFMWRSNFNRHLLTHADRNPWK